MTQETQPPSLAWLRHLQCVASVAWLLFRTDPVKVETRKDVRGRFYWPRLAGHGLSLFIGQNPIAWPRLPAKDAGEQSRHKPWRRRGPGLVNYWRGLSGAEGTRQLWFFIICFRLLSSFARDIVRLNFCLKHSLRECVCVSHIFVRWLLHFSLEQLSLSFFFPLTAHTDVENKTIISEFKIRRFHFPRASHGEKRGHLCTALGGWCLQLPGFLHEQIAGFWSLFFTLRCCLRSTPRIVL